MMNSTLRTQYIPLLTSVASSVASINSLAGSYIFVATLTAFMCDWLLTLADDFIIARKCGVSLSILAYFLSRTGTLASCLMGVILPAASVGHCETLLRLEEISAITATSATSFLFLIRVRAVYENSRSITVFFGAFWLGVVGTSVLILVSARAFKIEDVGGYILNQVKPWSLAFLWVKAAYDTSIFLAISLRITLHTMAGHTQPNIIRLLLRGHGLSRICRDLLRSGQLYYFATITMTVGGAITTVIPVHPILHVVFSEPTLALESSMACRVFRVVVVASISEPPSTCTSMFLTTFIPPGQEGLSNDACDIEVCDGV